MCGFVAIRGKTNGAELHAMAAAVSHRGPDGEGAFGSESFSAIHHRLSIIGPDERGSQPMTRDGVTVVFNGCIYNYHELRQRLEADGVVFRSDTDTEILPHLYRRFGFGMFSLLGGMFAIVLWDAREKTLIAGRDPFGEKPLFVCEQDGRIGLASTLSAFEKGNWSLTPNLNAVSDMLCRMRIEAPQTLYREVKQLPAGYYAVARGSDDFALRRYFFLPEADQPLDMAPQEIEADVAALLDDAFLKRTMSDRPMGVFLSGGVDSSLLAESLVRQGLNDLHTYSVRFAGGSDDYDESPFAGRVAAYIGTTHDTLEVAADAVGALDDLAAAFDQPVTNAAALPTYLICKAAKAHVDVALSGVGGDELFGGYPRYLGMLWHDRFRRMPGRGAMQQLLHLLGERESSSRNRRGRLRRFVQGLDGNAADAYSQWMRTTDAHWQQMFTLPEEDVPAADWVSAADAEGGVEGLVKRYGEVNGAMAYDLLTYLPDDLLAMGDRMSMAHALELRAPFLDTRLLAAVLTLNARCKVAGPPWREGLKLMLKNIARKRLPAEIVDRPKQGFMAPVKHWLRGPLDDEIRALIAGRPLGGLVRPEFVQEQWQRHRQGEDRSDMLWGLLLADRWMQQRKWRFE